MFATLKWQEGKCNAPFPIRFKGDFGGDEDMGPAAKEDVDGFPGSSRAPGGPFLLLFGENFKTVGATSKPDNVAPPEGSAILLNQAPRTTRTAGVTAGEIQIGRVC